MMDGSVEDWGDKAFDSAQGVVRFPVVASGVMGTVHDHTLHLDPHTTARAQLEKWLAGARSAAIVDFHVGHHSTEVHSPERGQLTIPERPRSVEWGGNAHNTFRAMQRVAAAYGSSDRLSLVADYADGLDDELRNTLEPDNDSKIELRDPRQGVPIRQSLVIEGNGDPIYLKIQPSDLRAAPLPDAPEVFVSSYSCDQTGQDLWDEIMAYRQRNPQGRILLSPGSVQIKTGIPTEIFPHLHLLACNRSEALQLLQRLNQLTPQIQHDPERLTRAFIDLGVREVRITDGGNGVYAMTQGQSFYQTPVIARDHPLVLKLVRRHLVNGPELAHLQKNPDFNGCGDGRLGTELAARSLRLFEDPRKAVLFSALLATLQSYNPRPNIGNFPDRLIFEAAGLAEQLFQKPERLERLPLAAK